MIETTITSRRHSLSDHLKDYIEKKVAKLEKYAQGAGEAHVVMERNDTGQIVEITFHGLQKVMHVREQGDNVLGCVDKAIEKIETQARKHKEKLTEKRA